MAVEIQSNRKGGANVIGGTWQGHDYFAGHYNKNGSIVYYKILYGGRIYGANLVGTEFDWHEFINDVVIRTDTNPSGYSFIFQKGSTGNYGSYYFDAAYECIAFIFSSYAYIGGDANSQPWFGVVDYKGNFEQLGGSGSPLSIQKVTNSTTGKEYIQVNERTGYKRLWILFSRVNYIIFGNAPTT